jgi:hypothetical protein
MTNAEGTSERRSAKTPPSPPHRSPTS